MAYSAGTVFLQVVPSYRGFQESVRRQAREAAKAFKGEFENETGAAISDALRDSGTQNRRAAQRLGADLGDEIGGATRQAMDKHITAAMRALPKVKIDADATPLQRAVAKARAELDTLRKGNASLDLDTSFVRAQIAQVQGDLLALHAMAERGSDVDIDVGSALASLASLEGAAAAATRDRTLNVDVDAHDNGSLQRVAAQGDDAANSFRAFNAVILAAVTLGPMLVPILGALAGGLAAIGPMAISAALGLGVTILALSGIFGAVGALNDAQKNAAKDALASSKTMRSASNGIRDAEQALARARQDSARAQEDAARRVADARRNLADVERRAAETIKDAQDRLADARENQGDVARRVNREIEAAERRVAEAIQRVADAREDAARRTADAIERVGAAERRMAESQRAVLDAQEDLNRARQQAADDLEDLAARAAGGALAERQAVLDLADAKKQYDRVMGREFKSARSVEEVTLAYEEAQLALENIRRENARTAEELDEANRTGVEGTERVQDAQQRLADARQAEIDAATALRAAEQDVIDARLEGERQVSDAIEDRRLARQNLRQTEADADRERLDAAEAIREAEAGLRDARIEAARMVTDAERSVADARREARESAEASAQRIADAQQNLTDAQIAYRDALEQTAIIGSASMQKLNEAMGALSPAGQAFARFLFGLKDEFLALRQIAEMGMLPGLQEMMTTIIDTYGPGFTKWVGKMARVAGDLFVAFGEMITTNPLWREFFETFDKISPRLFRQFGETTLNWMTIFVTLMEAFAPLALKASEYLLGLSERVVDWAGALEDTKGFADFMAWLDRVLPKVAEFLGALFDAIINIAVAMAPIGEVLLDLFTGILNFIAGMDPQTLQLVILAILGITFALQLAYAASTLLLTGMTVFATVLGTVVFVVGLVIVAVILMYQKFEWFRLVVHTTIDLLSMGWKSFSDVVVWYWENAIKPAIDALADAARWLWENVLSPIFGFMGDAWKAWSDQVAWNWENVVKPVLGALESAARWLWNNVLSPIFGFIGEAFGVLATGIQLAWRNVWKPVFEAIGVVAGALWELGLKVVFAAIEGAFNVLAGVIQFAWREIIKPAWDAFRDAIEWAWNNVFEPVFSAFGDIVEGLAPIFETAVGAIGKAWESLENLAKAPIRFIIETVINKGFIGTFNKIAGFFDTKKMGEIALPAGFARGGYTGPGGRYEPAGIVHRDEYVISSPARQRFERTHPGFLDYLNTHGTLPGYARGGTVRPIKAPFGLPWGNTYSGGRYHSGQDFPAATGTPVVAVLAGVVKSALRLLGSYGHHVILGHGNGLETLYAHLAHIGVKPGQVVAPGQPLGLSGSTGNSTGPHLHFEWRPGGGYSNAVDPRPFLTGAAEPSGDGSFFPDWMSNPFRFLKGKVTGALDQMGDSAYANLLKGMPLKVLDWGLDAVGGAAKGVLGAVKGTAQAAADAAGSAWDFVNGPFGGRGDAKLYDDGGMLPPGITTVVNASGRPEPVFSAQQWDMIARGGGPGSAPAVSIGTMVAADVDEAVEKIRTSQSDAAAINGLRDIAAGV